MSSAYSVCYNLTGSPVCGNNVTTMYWTYSGCANLHGNIYMYANNVTNVYRCFYQRNVSNMLNIYLYKDSNTCNTIQNTTNESSIVGANIIWTTTDKGFYNTESNIYVYYL